MPISGGFGGFQFIGYSYSGALAAGAEYVPAADTIVMTAKLNVGAAAEFRIMYGAIRLWGNPTDNYGYLGATICDGTLSYKNADAASKTLVLVGMILG